jgi:hypothetical protein
MLMANLTQWICVKFKFNTVYRVEKIFEISSNSQNLDLIFPKHSNALSTDLKITLLVNIYTRNSFRVSTVPVT